MRCQRAQQRLMAYHDGELSHGAARRLEKHLESCADCSQLLEDLRVADRHASMSEGVNPMVGVPDMPPPGDNYWKTFTARVLDRVEEDAATRAPDRKRPRRSWDIFIPRMAPAFSIALVVVIALGVYMKTGDLVPVPEAPAPVAKTAPGEKADASQLETPVAEPEPVKRDHDDALDEVTRKAAVEKEVETGGSFRSTSSVPTAAAREGKEEEKQAPEPAGASVGRSAELSPIASATDEAEREALAKAEAERVAIAKAEAEREALAKAEAEREALAKAEAEREALAKAEAEREALAKAEAEREALAKAEAEREALAKAEADKARARAVQAKKDLSSAALAPVVAGQEGKVAAASAGEVQKQQPVPFPEPDGNEIAPVESRNAAMEPPLDILLAEKEVSPAPAGLKRGLVDNLSSTAARKDEPALEEATDADTKLLGPLAEVTPDRAVTTDALPAAGSKTVEPEVVVAESAPSPREANQKFAPRRLPYRGPEDQLIHARNLADVRKFWESEQVLKDLLTQRPPSPIQEEASLLLVKVLSSQNRIGEAQRVLDDAKGQYPANDMIQTYELKQEGERPVQ